MLSNGHTLQFTSVPPRFNGIVETTLSSKDQQLSLLAELQQLLAKKVISTVPKGEEMQGFYSRYFLVPKKTGGLRPILDLALFNKCIAERPFHMFTIRRVLQCVKPVHLNRFEGRLLPRHSDPQAQEIPAFLIPRVTLPVQPSPVRLFSSPTNVFQMRGDGSPAAARNRNESTVLLGRSAFDGSLQGGSSYSNKKAGNSPVEFRFRHKLEELPPPLTE